MRLKFAILIILLVLFGGAYWLSLMTNYSQASIRVPLVLLASGVSFLNLMFAIANHKSKKKSNVTVHNPLFTLKMPPPSCKPQKVVHRFEIGENLTYLIVVLGITAFLFAMSYFHLWDSIK